MIKCHFHVIFPKMVNKHYSSLMYLIDLITLLLVNQSNYCVKMNSSMNLTFFVQTIASRDVNLKLSNQFISDNLQLLLIFFCIRMEYVTCIKNDG